LGIPIHHTTVEVMDSLSFYTLPRPQS